MAGVLLTFFLVIFTVWSATTNGQIRPTGGSGPSVVTVNAANGKVRVFHEGRWTSICGNQWDNTDAQVVCRMEGYWHGQGLADLRPADPSEVILLDNVNCTGTENTLDQCALQGWTQRFCDIHEVAAVKCDPSGADAVHARLVEGYGPWEGRLEVESGGVWGPVCHHGFDDLDAQVVCRMFGLRTDGGKAHAEQKFPQSNLPPLIHELDCTGHETDLAQCKGKRAAAGEQCTNVGVECYNCGRVFTTPNGTIESKNYPLSYPGNLDCLYLIQPTNGQQLYKLQFTNFSTEACCDTLKVQVLGADSKLSGVPATFSGTNSPQYFLGKAFALNFVTDGTHSLLGFRATWSPASVQDVTSVTCEAGHFRVEIDLGFLRRLYPESSPLTISLADPNCTGSVVSSRGGQEDHLVILADTDSCGSRVETQDSAIVYHNFIVDRVYAQGSRLIVRRRRWEIPIHCQVARTDAFQIHYNPLADLLKREAEMDGTAHARNRREVRGSLSAEVDFPIEISVFKDRTYTSLDTKPVRRRLGDDLDLRVQMTGGDPDLKMVLQNCSALPVSHSSVVYNIIQNGCAVDTQTEIIHIRQHSTDFRFTAFEFADAGEFPTVMIWCDVIVCPANENSAQCTQQCGSSVSLIGKRLVSEPIINHKMRFEQYRVHFGPIVLKK